MNRIKSLLVVLLFFAAHNIKADSFRSAMDKCIAETGVPKRDPSGGRPSKEDRAKVKACLKNRGFEKPKRLERVEYRKQFNKTSTSLKT